jgi:hypothetical protein
VVARERIVEEGLVELRQIEARRKGARLILG